MNTGLPDFGAWFYYIWGAKMAWFWQNYATAWRSALICFTSVMQKASWEQKCLNATPCFLPHSWHVSCPILGMLSYPKSGMVHAPFIPCFLTPYLAWIFYHDSPTFMVSNRDNTGMVSGVHFWHGFGAWYRHGFGKDFGHDSWSRFETKLHGFGGDCKGGIFGMDLM